MGSLPWVSVEERKPLPDLDRDLMVWLVYPNGHSCCGWSMRYSVGEDNDDPDWVEYCDATDEWLPLFYRHGQPRVTHWYDPAEHPPEQGVVEAGHTAPNTASAPCPNCNNASGNIIRNGKYKCCSCGHRWSRRT